MVIVLSCEIVFGRLKQDVRYPIVGSSRTLQIAQQFLPADGASARQHVHRRQTADHADRAVRHAMINSESVSRISRHKFARITRRNISDRISACSHGLSGLSRCTDIRFATQPYIPITHHLLLHPCPSCRTPIIYNTPPYALSVDCAMSRISHTAPYPTSSHPL